MAGEPLTSAESAPTQQHKEKFYQTPLAEKLCIGHGVDDFDIDQAVLIWLANRIGVINVRDSENGVVENTFFSKKPSPETGADRNIFTAEGVTNQSINIKKGAALNNWADGEDGSAAAEVFYTRYKDEISKSLPPKENEILAEFMACFGARERGKLDEYIKNNYGKNNTEPLEQNLEALAGNGKKKKGKNNPRPAKYFNFGSTETLSNTYENFQNIFFAIRHKYQDEPTKMVEQAMQLLDLMMDEGREPVELNEQINAIVNFSEIAITSDLTGYNQARTEYKKALKERITGQDKVKVAKISSLVGQSPDVNIGYFDTRDMFMGENAFPTTVMTGTTEAVDAVKALSASNGKEPDIVVLVGVEKSEDLKEIVGDRITIKLTNNAKKRLTQSEFKNLETLLQELNQRINKQNELFGKGAKAAENDGYGGDGAIIASPKESGTPIPVDRVWDTVQNFFATNRYTEEEISAISQSITDALDLSYDTFVAGINNPKSPSQPGERFLEINIPSENGEDQTVVLPEKDIPLYLEIAETTQDPQTLREIFLAKNGILEHFEVTKKRTELATEKLNDAIASKDANQALTFLEALNTQGINSLPIATKLELLSLISENEDAISKIWDKDNKYFRITNEELLPEWILNDVQKYQEERYTLESIPKKVDSTLIQSIISNLSRNPDQNLHKAFVNQVLSILKSESYRNSHTEAIFDSLLPSLLEHLVLVVPDEQKQSLVGDILREFTDHDSENVWMQALKKYPWIFLLMQQQPSIFSGLTERLKEFSGFEDELSQKNNNLPMEGLPAGILERIEDNKDLKDRIVKSAEELDDLGVSKDIPVYVSVLAELGNSDVGEAVGVKGIRRLEKTEAGEEIVENWIGKDVSRNINTGHDVRVNYPARLKEENERKVEVTTKLGEKLFVSETMAFAISIKREVIETLNSIRQISTNESDKQAVDRPIALRIIRGRFSTQVASLLATLIQKAIESGEIREEEAEMLRWTDFAQGQYIDSKVIIDDF